VTSVVGRDVGQTTSLAGDMDVTCRAARALQRRFAAMLRVVRPSFVDCFSRRLKVLDFCERQQRAYLPDA